MNLLLLDTQPDRWAINLDHVLGFHALGTCIYVDLLGEDGYETLTIGGYGDPEGVAAGAEANLHFDALIARLTLSSSRCIKMSHVEADVREVAERRAQKEAKNA